jgi:hypothetical protein
MFSGKVFLARANIFSDSSSLLKNKEVNFNHSLLPNGVSSI